MLVVVGDSASSDEPSSSATSPATSPTLSRTMRRKAVCGRWRRPPARRRRRPVVGEWAVATAAVPSVGEVAESASSGVLTVSASTAACDPGGAAAPTATTRSGPAAARSWRPTAARAARPRSPAEGKRSAGSLASARTTTPLRASGTPSDRAGRRLVQMRPQRRLVRLAPVGRLPGQRVTAARSRARRRRSLRPRRSPRICSGATNPSVPTQPPAFVAPDAECTRFVRPKSVR